MRCRKVRSCLSAYCSDELGSRQRLAVSEHLAECAACRREEALYRSISTVSRELPSLKLGNDFNNALLNRIAQERFVETRTRAYLPKAAPLFSWTRLVPAVASAALVVLAVILTLSPSGLQPTDGQWADTRGTALDDSYLTVQPENNPNVTAKLNEHWSLSRHMADAERMNRLSNTVSNTQFGELVRGGGLMQVSATDRQVPYVRNFYRVRPVVRVYQTPETSSRKEVQEVY